MPDLPPGWSPHAALGDEGVARLIERFFHHMNTLPEASGVRAMHSEDLGVIKKKLTLFFKGWMGGPREYSKLFPDAPPVPAAHASYPISQREIDAWLLCMEKALTDVAPADLEEFAAIVMPGIRQMAAIVRNRDD